MTVPVYMNLHCSYGYFAIRKSLFTRFLERSFFEMERKWKEATPEQRYEARLAESRPILDAFSAWLEAQRSRVLPKSLLGTDITYSTNQWEKLNVFLQDGRLEIDNNRSERSIKPVVIGRKNFLFGNTPRGARASTIIYSIVETAKANGLKPHPYLQHFFERLPQLPNPADPWSVKQACSMVSFIAAYMPRVFSK